LIVTHNQRRLGDLALYQVNDINDTSLWFNIKIELDRFSDFIMYGNRVLFMRDLYNQHVVAFDYNRIFFMDCVGQKDFIKFIDRYLEEHKINPCRNCTVVQDASLLINIDNLNVKK